MPESHGCATHPLAPPQDPMQVEHPRRPVGPPSASADEHVGAQSFAELSTSGGGGAVGGGLTPPPPADPHFIVGKHELLQTEVLIGAVWGTQPFGLLGSRDPPSL